MALKFLNKKGWHTGSLRNIENVWKAEQKHETEQKKLEELRKQIQEERHRSDFRILQEQAGLVPRQERLDFLYESGLSVGKGSSDGFKALEALPKPNNAETPASTSGKQTSAPGALFEEKRESANDEWRKLHSDPLLMIRQREQEALARVKNNPVQMAMIRRSVEAQKKDQMNNDKKELKRGLHHKSKHQKHSSSKKRSKSRDLYEGDKMSSVSDKQKRWPHESRDRGKESKRSHYRYLDSPPGASSDLECGEVDKGISSRNGLKCGKRNLEGCSDRAIEKDSRSQSFYQASMNLQHRSYNKSRNVASRLSEEERAARLQEMQMDAELHEEQRWKRLRKADEDDAREAMQAGTPGSGNFLDAAQRSVYGTDRPGSATIEKSVRRRTHYLQDKSDGERNAFKR